MRTALCKVCIFCSDGAFYKKKHFFLGMLLQTTQEKLYLCRFQYGILCQFQVAIHLLSPGSIPRLLSRSTRTNFADFVYYCGKWVCKNGDGCYHLFSFKISTQSGVGCLITVKVAGSLFEIFLPVILGSILIVVRSMVNKELQSCHVIWIIMLILLIICWILPWDMPLKQFVIHNI